MFSDCTIIQTKISSVVASIFEFSNFRIRYDIRQTETKRSEGTPVESIEVTINCYSLADSRGVPEGKKEFWFDSESKTKLN